MHNRPVHEYFAEHRAQQERAAAALRAHADNLDRLCRSTQCPSCFTSNFEPARRDSRVVTFVSFFYGVNVVVAIEYCIRCQKHTHCSPHKLGFFFPSTLIQALDLTTAPKNPPLI